MARTAAAKPPPARSTGSTPGLVWVVGDRLLAEERWRALVGSSEVVRLDGKRLDVAALSREIGTLPMFAEHKWILVSDFRLPGKRGGAEDDARPDSPQEAGAEAALLDALGQIGPTATVILVSETGDRRTRLFKLVQSSGEYIECPGLREHETGRAAEWATERLAALGRRIAPALAQELVEAVGIDLGLLASELEKLSIAMGEETAVTAAHLDVVAGAPTALRRFVEEGILRKRGDAAQALLERAFAANEHPLRILASLNIRIRELLRARLCPEARRDSAAATALFGAIHPYRLRLLYEESDRFSAAELRAAIHSLVLADTCLKSSVDGKLTLALLTAALTGGITHAEFERAVSSYVEPWD
jgi:DNA polymerase III delta subunit